MNRFRSILGIIAVFLLGMLAGGLITFLVFRAIVTAPRRAYLQGGGEGVANLVARQFSRRLRTDAGQEAQIRQILRDTAVELEGVAGRVAPEVRETMEKAETRVRAVLKPEQQAEFDKMMQRARETWRKVQAQPAEGLGRRRLALSCRPQRARVALRVRACARSRALFRRDNPAVCRLPR